MRSEHEHTPEAIRERLLAGPGVSYLIVAVDRSRVVDIRSWRIDAAGRDFEEEPLNR